MMWTTICLVCLYSCVSLSSGNSSNLKHELLSTKLIEFQPSSSDHTNITIEEDSLWLNGKVILGRSEEPGNEMGQNPSFSNITWKWVRLDNGKTFLVDSGQFKVSSQLDKITNFVRETVGLNISAITRVDIPAITRVDMSNVTGLDFSACFMFAIKANDSLMMWCDSNNLRTVGSSFQPFHYARAMSFHDEALYVAGYDGTKWFTAEVDFGVKAGEIYIKGIHLLELFDDKSVIRPENLSDETKLYVVNSSVVIARDPKSNVIRWFRLNITTVDEEGQITTTTSKGDSTRLSGEMKALISVSCVAGVIIVILVVILIVILYKYVMLRRRTTENQQPDQTELNNLTREDKLREKETALTTLENELREKETALTRRENELRENQQHSSPPPLGQHSTSLGDGLEIITHNPDDADEHKPDNDGRSGSVSEDSSPVSDHSHHNLLPNSGTGSALQ